ncbi:hypothetical protein CYMTET_44157 [Cymbomonas tetramitiformis]|uniref:RING-type domain-containing protein n=1 Tax=Cymbomonas tetramitiformis TaxID=36881 RepID=A0AAE0C0Q5_9CHLO|nr:hypothetical protein CYMTET_44157 [Cymbomonas tetramitiformis]
MEASTSSGSVGPPQGEEGELSADFLKHGEEAQMGFRMQEAAKFYEEAFESSKSCSSNTFQSKTLVALANLWEGTLRNTEKAAEYRVALAEVLQSRGVTKFDECSICLEGASVNDPVWVLPCCHFFHKECLQTYFKTGKTEECPECRTCCNELGSPLGRWSEPVKTGEYETAEYNSQYEYKISEYTPSSGYQPLEYPPGEGLESAVKV